MSTVTGSAVVCAFGYFSMIVGTLSDKPSDRIIALLGLILLIHPAIMLLLYPASRRGCDR